MKNIRYKKSTTNKNAANKYSNRQYGNNSGKSIFSKRKLMIGCSILSAITAVVLAVNNLYSGETNWFSVLFSIWLSFMCFYFKDKK